MARLLLCFKPMRDEHTRHSGASLGQGLADRSTGTQESSRHTVAYVELLKHSTEPLGLVLHGGKDLGVPVQVEAIRPGGVAAKSGALQPGDWILGINGVPTQNFMQTEVNTLLQNAGNVINLEIAFEAPPGPSNDDHTVKKTATINLPRENNENNSYGFTISGGRTENRPITVSNITLNTTAYRNGFLKAGDHILKVNGVDVTQTSQKETVDLLKSSGEICSLEIQYDVPVHNVLAEAQGPMLVELLKPRGVSLGISLRLAPGEGEPLKISRIKEAGIADRCGALHVGDSIVSLNGVSLKGKSVQDAYQTLKYCDLHMQLEILPGQNLSDDPFDDAVSSVSRLPSFSSQLSRRPSASQLSVSSMATSTRLTYHPESMTVSLTADEVGFGLSLQGGATEYTNFPITISTIEDGGPAARLGQLQVGDRVLAISGVNVDTCTLQQAVKLVKEAGHIIELEIMFEIQDAIVPTSGTFEVTLVKTASLNFGITINGSIHHGDQIWISRLKKGGIAYRTGMLHSGDILLAINGVGLETANLSQAAEMLKNAGERVSLKVSKDNVPTVPETVVFSVVIHRNQQSLGITLTGNRDTPGHPVVISKIKADGVAYKTGTLNVGDSVLAINGQSLVSATLPQAVYMLSTAGDVVQLKIRKATSRTRKGRGSPPGKIHRPGSFRGTGRVNSRAEGQESYSRLLALRARRFSQSTIASTVSGRSTPDNHSTISMDESSYNGSFYAQPINPSGRDSMLSQLTPSEFGGSAFSRPSSALSNSGKYRFNGLSQNGGDGYSVTPPQSSIEFQRRLGFAPRLPPPIKDVRSETDEELSQYSGWEDNTSKQWTLPMHRPGSKKWDFKSRRRSSFKAPKLIGRVSPLTPSDPPDFSSSPPFLANKRIPPSPVKDMPLLEVSDIPEEIQVTVESTENNEETNIEETNSEVHVIEAQRPDSKLSSVGSNNADTERPEFRGSTSVSGEESQSTMNSPEPPPTQLLSLSPCATPTITTEEGTGEWPPSDILPGYEEEDTQNQEPSSSPTTLLTTVKVLKTVAECDHNPSTGSLTRKTPKAAMSESINHPAKLCNGASISSSQASLMKTDVPRRTSAPDFSIAMKSKHQSTEPKSKSISSFDPSNTMQDYKQTIYKANEFEKAMRALAESGSSDQDSDSEPHGNQSEAVSVSESEKINDKMRTDIPNNQLNLHHVSLKRRPGTSFGFSLADGCYDPGIFVKAVKDGSPADKAGLLPFDIVIKIGDTALQTEHTCQKIDPLLKQSRDYLELTVARQHHQVAGDSYC